MKTFNHKTNFVIENSNNTGKWQAELKKNKSTKEFEIVFSKRENNSSFGSKIKDFLTGAKTDRNLAAKHLASLNLTEGLPLIKDSTKGKITNQSLDNLINAVIKKAGPDKKLFDLYYIFDEKNDSSFESIGTKEENILIIDKKTDAEIKSLAKDLIGGYYKNQKMTPENKKILTFTLESAISFIKGEPTNANKNDILAGFNQLRIMHLDAAATSENYTLESRAELNNLINVVPVLSDDAQRIAFDKKFQLQN